jgi:predicted ATPase
MDVPLLGRERECAVLRQLLQQVRQGRSAVLTSRGEAGIGKTDLLHYMSEQTAGFTTLRSGSVRVFQDNSDALPGSDADPDRSIADATFT